MTILNANEIIAVLKREHALQVRHSQILEAQQRALMACDRVRFCALEGDYADLLVLLEKQDTARRAALTDEAGDALTVTAVLESLPEGRTRLVMQTLRDGLRKTLAYIETLSRRNEMLIRNELNYLTFTMDVFVEAGRSAGQSYGGATSLGGRLGLDRRA